MDLLLTGHAFDALAATRDKCHLGAAASKLPDECQPQARRAARDGNAQAGERVGPVVLMFLFHDCLLRLYKEKPLLNLILGRKVDFVKVAL
jgi:hypothetical protein